MNYPAGVEAVLPDILRGSYMAASNITHAGGLHCGAHCSISTSPYFIKLMANETWYRENDLAPFDVLGVDDEPIHLFSETRRREIYANPRMFLLTKAYKLTPEIYNRLMNEKNAGVAQYDALLAQWRTIEPVLPPDDYRCRAMTDMLEKNTQDARRFRACLSLFWRYHMSALTESDIIEAKAELLGSHAPCSINTCDEYVSNFLDNLRSMLLNLPLGEQLELPQITNPGWEEGDERSKTWS